MGLSPEDPLTLPPGLRPLARVVCLLFCKEMGGAPSQHGCNDQMSQPSPAPGITARSLRRRVVLLSHLHFPRGETEAQQVGGSAGI